MRPQITAALFVFVALATTLQARPQRVSFQTEDGATIAGAWYEPEGRRRRFLDFGRSRASDASRDQPTPAVVLVHMLNRSRSDWEGVASRLSAEGIAALAIDLRGHGDSRYHVTGEPGVGYDVMVQDIRGARRYLASRVDVQPGKIGIAGASLGANLAALAAADGGFASVALLSPSLDYRGLRIEAAVRAYGGGPMLLVSSDDDPYARRSAAELQKTGAGRELLTLSGAGHGTNMLSRAPELQRHLVDWFSRTLQ